MKFYISTTGVKRVTIGKESLPQMKGGKGTPVPAHRRIFHRTFFPALLVLAIVLPFLFVRIAFLVLESATACSSSLDCMRWRFFGGGDASLLRDEVTKAVVESGEGRFGDEGGMESSVDSFNDLVRDVTSNRHDIKTFAFKTKAMLLKMERRVQTARQRESIFWHIASHGVPKNLHCLCLRLAEEYAVNAMARSRLPPPELVSRLVDPSFHHLVLLTDNVLAASVVISSTIQNSANPKKLVFHVITDKKTYTPMHAWFAINSIESAAIEVKGLHQYDWSQEVNVGVKEMLEIHRLICRQYYNNFEYKGEDLRKLEGLSPTCLSLMKHLRIYIPEMFPDLNKIVFLDDDVVVQHDLASLWEMDLDGKVIGAVFNSWCGDGCCPGRKYKDYFNFSNPIISSKFDNNCCGWLYGMNVLDLKAWRSTNITKTYHHWLKLNLKSGLGLWQPGVLPPALIAFDNHVHPIDPLWHTADLGYHSREISREILEASAVIHYSGPAKPWLEIGFPEVRGLWTKHVNSTNKFIRKCRILG